MIHIPYCVCSSLFLSCLLVFAFCVLLSAVFEVEDFPLSFWMCLPSMYSHLSCVVHVCTFNLEILAFDFHLHTSAGSVILDAYSANVHLGLPLVDHCQDVDKHAHRSFKMCYLQILPAVESQVSSDANTQWKRGYVYMMSPHPP